MIAPSPMHNRITGQIIDAAFAVHRALGPGLLETVYEQCLAYELGSRGLTAERQVLLPVIYRDMRLGGGFRIDMLVADQVIVEIKAAERIMPVHEAQLLTYLKLSQKQLGLLLNFNVPLIKDGIRRMAL